MKLRQKRKRSDVIAQIQSDLSLWYENEMVLDSLPTLPPVKKSSPVVLLPPPSNTFDDGQETAQQNFIIQNCLKNLINISINQEKALKNDKFSPKTWKFKLEGFFDKHPSAFKTPAVTHRKDTIAFPERLLHHHEPTKSVWDSESPPPAKPFQFTYRKKKRPSEEASQASLEAYKSPQKSENSDVSLFLFPPSRT